MAEFEVKHNGKHLDSLQFEKETGCYLFNRSGVFFISNVETKEEAQRLYDAHNPAEPTEPTVEEKLASVGLSIDDLKSALGLQHNL
jgi:hypothetical protein